MAIRCTWEGCQKQADHPQFDKNGRQWANLCKEHHDEIDLSIERLEPKEMLRAWVLASGGADKMTKRMSAGIRNIKRRG